MATTESRMSVELDQSEIQDVHTENILPPADVKRNHQGVTLVPQPSDDFQDPLNWPKGKKLLTLSIVCLASFGGVLQALANASGFVPQEKLYHKSPVQVSYSLSAAIAGLAVGPFVWTVLAARFGNSAVLFWSMILTLAVNIWSACMTRPGDYNAFVVSRLFGGLFGSAPTTVGASIIVQVFFLHDRGKCFAIYTSLILLGTVGSNTFSGFIVQSAAWPVQFWYNVALEGTISILCLLFLDETGWTRPGGDKYPPLPDGFVARRLATYALIRRVTPKKTFRERSYRAALPLIIGLSPVTFIVGIAVMICFSWSVAINTFLAVFLQEPVEDGGYGFSPLQNAAFSFASWIGLAAAQLWGHFINDRIPLAICSRNGGIWKAEYRLHSLWVPVLVVYPIGLGIVGGSLYYHWHYMVLALGCFMVVFAAVAMIPPCLNYIIEAFSPVFANEATATMNFYRLVFGIAITFFLFPWAQEVGMNWVFGTQAFLTIFAFGMIVLVMEFGPALRKLNLFHLATEEGVQIVQKENEKLGNA